MHFLYLLISGIATGDTVVIHAEISDFRAAHCGDRCSLMLLSYRFTRVFLISAIMKTGGYNAQYFRHHKIIVY